MITIENEETVKNNLLIAMNNASSIEELLELKRQFTKIFYTKYYTLKQKCFYENIERIAYINTLRNISNIVTDLVNNISIDEIKDKYNVTLKSIKRILSLYSKNGIYKNKITEIINKINKIEEDKNINHDLDFLCAKTAVQLLIDNDVKSEREVSSKTYINKKDYKLYLHILETKKHPLYYKYHDITTNHKRILCSNASKANKKKISLPSFRIDDYTNKDLVNILSNSYSKEFVNFVSYYNLSNIVFSSILKMNKSLIYEIANNRENIHYIYDYYVFMYRKVIEEVIRDIKLLSKNDFKSPLDLYKYYSNNYNLLYLAKIAKELPDLKNNTLLLSYVEKLSSLFVYLDEKSLNKIKLEGNMFCLSENINFTRDLFVKALEDIEDKGMPLLKGVLFTSIKRQVDIKNSKIKIK